MLYTELELSLEVAVREKKVGSEIGDGDGMCAMKCHFIQHNSDCTFNASLKLLSLCK